MWGFHHFATRPLRPARAPATTETSPSILVPSLRGTAWSSLAHQQTQCKDWGNRGAVGELGSTVLTPFKAEVLDSPKVLGYPIPTGSNVGWQGPVYC